MSWFRSFSQRAACPLPILAPRSHRSLAVLAWLVLALMSTGALAQSPLPDASPNLNLMTHGGIWAVVRQPDGGVVFGGSFTHVNGTPRNNIARLLPDGTLDPAWNPSADGSVLALAVAPSGAVYAGGHFTNIGGRARNNLAKLAGDGTGAANSTWNPSPNDMVSALAVDGNGDVYAGGLFTSFGGVARNRIAKHSGSNTGTVDATWNPSSNGEVLALAVDTVSNAIYVGGWFSMIGGQPRSGLAKLSASGAGAADANWNPSLNNRVYALAVDASGQVYAGGAFTQVGAASRSYLARWDSAGSLMPWNPSVAGLVHALAVDEANSAVYAGGHFTSIGGIARNRIARLSSGVTASVDANWNPSSSGGVYALALATDGTVHAGGWFTHIGGQFRTSLARLNASGAAEAALANVYDSSTGSTNVNALARQSDGGTIVGGNFVAADGMAHNNILRLRPDGTLDEGWSPQIDGRVAALAVDADDRVYVGGYFTRVSVLNRTNLARLNAAGVVHGSWNPAPDEEVFALAVDASGEVYAGGAFTQIGGVPRDHLAKLSGGATATVDATWNPSGANGWVFALALGSGSAVYVGGEFTSIGGLSIPRLALLGGSTGAVQPWNTPGASDTVRALAVHATGDVYVGGYFTGIGGGTRNRIAKLSSTGQVDPDWNPSANGSVYALAADRVDPFGPVFVGGEFSSLGGAPRSRIAKLSSIGAGTADPGWNPTADSIVLALSIDAATPSIHVGGEFSTISNQPRLGVARLPIVGEAIFSDGFE